MTTKTDTTALLAVTAVKGYRQATPTLVKAFARENGYKVSDRQGRLSMEVVHAFNKANKRRKVQYIIGSEVQDERTYTFNTAAGRKSKFKAQPKVLRAWLNENGHTTGERGRFSQAMLDAYGQAHAPKRAPRKPKAETQA